MLDKINFLDWFRTGREQPLRTLAKEDLQKEYRRHQRGIIINLVMGYSFFYTTRLSLSVAKKPLIDEGILSKEELGLMGSAMFFTYAIGKFTNGFFSDHANIRKFMSFGLLCSALINIFLGFISQASFFIFLWGLNGWFQSMGSAPSGVSIFQWFSPQQRGTRYALWAGSHNIGEGLTFVITSLVVAHLGWRWGFFSPGALSLLVVAVMFYFLRDRPQTLGLPGPAQAFDEPPDPVKEGRTFSAQLLILKSPVVWIIATSCAAMYIARYAINSWGILYLQVEKNYTLPEAGMAMAFYPIAGLLGAVLSGFISDKLFKSNRPIPIVIYNLFTIAGMVLLFYGPEDRVMDAVSLSLFGFGIGGLVVFLAGLFAADLMPKNAVGAVKGFIGLFSYIGASAQEYASSVLIVKTKIAGEDVYDFSSAIHFWVGSAVISMLLIFLVWEKKPLKHL